MSGKDEVAPDRVRLVEHVSHVLSVSGLTVGAVVVDDWTKWALVAAVVVLTVTYSAWLYACRRLAAVQHELIDAYKDGEALHEATVAELRRYRGAFAYAAAQKATRHSQPRTSEPGSLS